MDGEGGMNRSLMYGLIGIGVAIVIAALFIFLAIAGPKIFSEKAEGKASAELLAQLTAAQAELEATKAKLSDAEDTITAKEREIAQLERQVAQLERKPQAPASPLPAPPQNETIDTTPPLNIDDISTLTKANCNQAINLSRMNESAARNYTSNLSTELDIKRDLRDNITAELTNSTGNLTDNRKGALEDDLEEVEEDIDDLNDDIDVADERQDAAEARRKRVVYQCNKLLAA